MVLSGLNTYGGTTTVGGGTLQVTNLANAGTSSGIGTNGTIILTNGGTLDYAGTTNTSMNRGISLASGNGGIGVSNSAAALTISGVISNTGTLVKSGAGTLVLSGANTYSGGTLVSAGTLQGDSSGVQGSITNNSLVLFTNAGTGTYSGIMSGSGGLTLNGVGSLTLSGNNTYSGNTTIAAGTLVMNGVNTGAGIVTVTNFSVLRLGQTNALTNGVLVGTTSATNSGSVDLAVGGDHSIASYGSVGNGGGNMNFTNSTSSNSTGSTSSNTHWTCIIRICEEYCRWSRSSQTSGICSSSSSCQSTNID
jgi:fibronectin-binding autotransporter adhesin